MTIEDINQAFEDYAHFVFRSDDDVFLLPLYMDSNPDEKNIFCLRTLALGDVVDGELGMTGYSPRLSVYKLAFSALDGSYLSRLLQVVDQAEKAFRRKSLGDDDGITCNDPYTTNDGTLSDGRVSFSVTVPFSTWTCS